MLRGINGILHDTDYNIVSREQIINIFSELKQDSLFILKPATETGGGANVMLVKKTESGFETEGIDYTSEQFIDFLKKRYRNDFVFQHKINQHEWFRDFNESSLNTVRLYAYRSVKDETIHPIRAYVRFGIPGSLIDSSSQGGRTDGE